MTKRLLPLLAAGQLALALCAAALPAAAEEGDDVLNLYDEFVTSGAAASQCASPRSKPLAMCCTTRTAAGSSAGRAPRSRASGGRSGSGLPPRDPNREREAPPAT